MGQFAEELPAHSPARSVPRVRSLSGTGPEVGSAPSSSRTGARLPLLERIFTQPTPKPSALRGRVFQELHDEGTGV